MPTSLIDKIAIVSGASRGLGYAIALGLAQRGMHVVLAARSETPLRELATNIESLGRRAIILTIDLSLPFAASSVVSAALSAFGQIDLLVNNAGATKRGDFLALTDEDWHAGYELKLHGAVRLSRAAWPHLVKTNGSIINIAGVGGRTGNAEFTLGGSVNAALMLLTKALADRGVTDGVRVNAINPGAIRTDRLALRIHKLMETEQVDEATAAKRLAKQERIARFGEPREVADAVAFLASSEAAYINGAILEIDGGQTRGL